MPKTTTPETIAQDLTPQSGDYVVGPTVRGDKVAVGMLPGGSLLAVCESEEDATEWLRVEMARRHSWPNVWIGRPGEPELVLWTGWGR